MKQVTFVLGIDEVFEEKINEWLKEHNEAKVIDIKLTSYQSINKALIIYETDKKN